MGSLVADPRHHSRAVAWRGRTGPVAPRPQPCATAAPSMCVVERLAIGDVGRQPWNEDRHVVGGVDVATGDGRLSRSADACRGQQATVPVLAKSPVSERSQLLLDVVQCGVVVGEHAAEPAISQIGLETDSLSATRRPRSMFSRVLLAWSLAVKSTPSRLPIQLRMFIEHLLLHLRGSAPSTRWRCHPATRAVAAPSTVVPTPSVPVLALPGSCVGCPSRSGGVAMGNRPEPAA